MSGPALTGNPGDEIVCLSDGLVWRVDSCDPDSEGRPQVMTSGVGFDGVGGFDLGAARKGEWYADRGHPLVADYEGRRTLDPTGRFVPYFGNHHKSFKPSSTHWGGGVSFKRHLNKPLSASFAEDVFDRLLATKVLVYRHGDVQWCMGWGEGTCLITLDAAGGVSDVYWHPHRPAGWGDGFKGPLVGKQVMGGVVGHTSGLARADFR